MKKASRGNAGQGLALMDWLAYGAALLLFLAGQAVFMAGNVGGCISLVIVAVLVAGARLLLPKVPWAALGAALAGLSRSAGEAANKAVKAAKEPKPSAQAKARSPKAKPSAAALPGAWGLYWKQFFPDDLISLSRHWMGLPLALIVLMMQLAILKGNITRAGVDLALAGMLAAIYLQDLNRPLVLPKAAANLKTLFLLLPALPFQAWGVWLLWNYTHVWLGYFLTVAGSAWMLRVLYKLPFDLVEGSPQGRASLDYAPQAPWFSQQLLLVKASLVVGAAICAFLSLEVLDSAQGGLRVALGFLGIFLFIGSFPWFPFGLSSLPGIPKPLRAWIALGFVLLAFAVGVHAQALMEDGNKEASLWYFLLGGSMLILALSRFGGMQALQAKPGQGDPPWALKSEIFWVCLLVAVTFAFRAWHIGIFPYGAEGDEAGGGVWAMDALRGTVEHPLIHQNYPLHFFSVTAVFFKFFGVTLGTLRWHSVLFGTLSAASFYFFARLFLGRWSAWLAALLMTFSYWHIHFSRFGHYNIEQVFCQMAAFYFVFKGMKTGLWKYFVVSGTAFALAMFPHMAGRLLPFEGLAFVAYLLLLRRDLFRQNFSGLLAFVLGAWLVASPAVTYWLRATTVSMGRIQSVSIFDKNNSNAPIDVLAGFVQNCKVSILMFNDYSDSRSRDNPLAPQKILEHWSAILFALAFLYVLYHWRDPLNFFLLGCFFVNLSASVFSVEAPQTLRTAGNIPIVFAIIAVLFAHFHRALIELGWKWGTAIYAGILVPAVAFFSYRSAQKYFVESARLAFDVEPTYIAQMAGQRGKAADQAVFWATGFASSHPPVVLFTQKTPIRNFYHLNEYLPITTQADRDHHIFLADDYAQMLPYVQALYPQAKVEEIPDLLGGQPLAQYIFLPSAELKAAQGLRVSGRDAAGNAFSAEGADLKFPGPAIPPQLSHLHFSGSLRNEGYGLYQFSASGKGDVDLRLAGRSVYSRHGGLVHAVQAPLPEGLLDLSADFSPRGPQDAISISEDGVPTEFRLFCSLRGSFSETVGLAHLFRAKSMGLAAQYYATRDWNGPTVLQIVEPGIFAHWLDGPMIGNWSVKWRGKLNVLQPGVYSFRFNGMNTELRIDGVLVERGGGPVKPEMSPPRITPQVNLSKGQHEIEARFSTNGPPGMDLSWRRPDGIEAIIPATQLEPEF